MAEALTKEDMNPVILTKQDVERLMTDPSEDSRIGVLDKVAVHYNRAAFAEREHDIAEQIFRLLMKDAAIRVRETLAVRLQDNAEIPRDVALHMAADVDSVALPMLAHSKVFSDADLVTIIEASRDMPKLLTISKRDGVSPRVSDALVETHYPQVINSLLGNDSAKIDQRAYDKIIDDFRGESSVMSAMTERKQLPLAIVERMVAEASSAIAEQLKKKYNLTDEQLKKDSTSSREDVMLRLLSNDMAESEIEALVAQMAVEHRLTPSMVMTALCRGQLVFFAAAMGRFANVSLANARRLIADKGDLGFKALYEKSELPETMYHAVRLLLRAVQQLDGDEAIPGSLLYANRLVERVLDLAGSDNVEYLPYFIALIRQNIQRH
jgi:uncharacterized protein (DUF2336 family)